MMHPDQLATLMCESPFSQRMLLAAWDSMSVESRAQVLQAYRDQQTEPSITLLTRASNDASEWVRALAAGARALVAQNPVEADLLERQRSDPSPLVRASVRRPSEWLVAADLLDMTPLERQAMVWNDPVVDGALIAEFVEIADGSVPLDELADLMREYVLAKGTQRVFGDADVAARAPFCTATAFSAIWQLVPHAPLRVILPIIRYFPVSTCEGDSIPTDVLDHMAPEHLIMLLGRAPSSLSGVLDHLRRHRAKFPDAVTRRVAAMEVPPILAAIQRA
jgi:hypothetical protein